ncbi:hypothetical protein FS749_006420 [Ceratobasidium sp. UAMH 11750]|nr:hypothetical protein FS749_006420 [Ceratobasidium sp. UAMH 11750]
MYLVHFSLLFFVPLAFSQKLETRDIDDTYDYTPDRPDGIQYSSNWQTITSPSKFNKTVHLTDTRGSSLVYFFQGNAIYYYTDLSIQNAQIRIGVGDDREDLVATNASTGPLQPLWSKAGLGPGDHQITIRHAGVSGRYVGLDYLRIESDHGFTPNTTGPAAASVPSEALTVDNTSPDLVYSGNWTTVSSDTLWVYYGGSIAMSRNPGSTITFKFNGTAVWYFAAMFNLFSGTANISVDGEPADVINTFAPSALLQRLLWSKTGLPDGEHTVVLEHAGTDSTHANLDFFRYLPSRGDSSMGSSQSQKPTANIGAMVGGIIGGLVVVATLVFVFFYLRRRAKSANKPKLHTTPNAPSIPTHITPFEAPARLQWGYVRGSHLSGSEARTPAMTQMRPSKGSSLVSTPPQPRLSYDHSVMADEGGWESARTGLPGSGISEGPPPYVQ